MPRQPSCLCGDCPKCKRRAYMRDWYQRRTSDERREIVARRDPDKVKAADRARYYRDRDKRLARMRDYANANPEVVAAAKRRWIERNPEKRAAQVKLNNAVRDGRVVRGQCERKREGSCKGRIEAHHDDYTKPLEVRWLCASHHAEERRRQ